ncbi:SWIM-type domain-containing protein [Trichonephila inaurata madagascariensis]|uniref:SWIM-type domain-containing protein n=1 Tax=Trichonephila inaurata madagascariensis TaxID=2747483 RepID=A0A8X7CTD8_9ARAC|nr:SWIM-type domain-containing protein [Trichonephila inaurata madagascariensis]
MDSEPLGELEISKTIILLFQTPIGLFTAVLQIHNGTTVKVHEDHLWAVLLVTPVIKRNHHLSSSKEIIFIDSTSSCEASSSTITILLSATKVGALLFAVMIHASQSIQNYINAFQLLKINLPQCFGGTRLSRSLYE